MCSIFTLKVKSGRTLGTRVREIESQGGQEILADRTGKCCLTSYRAPLSLTLQGSMFCSNSGDLFFFFPHRICSSAVDLAVSTWTRKPEYLKATTPKPCQWIQPIGKNFLPIPQMCLPPLKICPSQRAVAAGLYPASVILILWDNWCALTCMCWVCHAALSSSAPDRFLISKCLMVFWCPQKLAWTWASP